jgi:hypothetical protein
MGALSSCSSMAMLQPGQTTLGADLRLIGIVWGADGRGWTTVHVGSACRKSSLRSSLNKRIAFVPLLRAKQIRQLRDVRRDPSRLVAREQGAAVRRPASDSKKT